MGAGRGAARAGSTRDGSSNQEDIGDTSASSAAQQPAMSGSTGADGRPDELAAAAAVRVDAIDWLSSDDEQPDAVEEVSPVTQQAQTPQCAPGGRATGIAGESSRGETARAGGPRPGGEQRATGHGRKGTTDNSTQATAHKRLTAQDVLGAQVHAVLCAVRGAEQERQRRKREREQGNEAEAASATMRTNQQGTLRVVPACRRNEHADEEEKQRKPKTPRVETHYYRAYPERTVSAQDEGIWDGRPKRKRVPDGAYDEVQRRQPRQGQQRVRKRRRMHMVPAGRRGNEAE